LGVTNILGLEYDAAACETRYAAGHKTWRQDIGAVTDEQILTLAEWAAPDGGVVGLIGSPPCFPPDVPVVTKRGVIPIGDVVVGDLVLTHNNRWQPVTAVNRKRAEVLSDGTTTATSDHPFWMRAQIRAWDNQVRQYTWDLSEPEWTEFGSAQGRFGAIPHNIKVNPMLRGWVPPSAPFPLTAAFFKMVGRWLGDGWVRLTDDQYRRGDVLVCCGKHERDALVETVEATGLNWRVSEERTTFRATCHSRQLAVWLVEHFGRGADGKRLPTWVFDLPRGLREALWAGYVEADGTSDGVKVRVSTVSRCLAVSMRLLATGLGFTTSLRRSVRDRDATIEGRPVKEFPTWTLIVTEDDGRYTRLGVWWRSRHCSEIREEIRSLGLCCRDRCGLLTYMNTTRPAPKLTTAAEAQEAVTPFWRVKVSIVEGNGWDQAEDADVLFAVGQESGARLVEHVNDSMALGMEDTGEATFRFCKVTAPDGTVHLFRGENGKAPGFTAWAKQVMG
jgi:hypothetical protein